jgi:hypothetical protein
MVLVRFVDGRTHEVPIDPAATIHDLAMVFAAELQMEPSVLRFVHDGRVLGELIKLKSLNMARGDFLICNVVHPPMKQGSLGSGGSGFAHAESPELLAKRQFLVDLGFRKDEADAAIRTSPVNIFPKSVSNVRSERAAAKMLLQSGTMPSLSPRLQ